jgi:hypothetical protein
MAALDNSVQVVILLETVTPSVAGFGIPLLAGAASFAERVRVYTDNAGVKVDEDASLISAFMADGIRAAFAQTPRVASAKIGRVEPDQAQLVTWTIGTGTAVSGDKFDITVNGQLGTFTAVGGESESVIATAVRAALTTALSGEPVTVGGTGADITVTADIAGVAFTFSSLYTPVTPPGPQGLTEVTTAPNINLASELQLIADADSDWYGLAIESRAAAENQEAANWVQGDGRRIFIAQSSDADLLTAVTTDLASTLNSNNYFRSAVAYKSQDTEHGPMSWMGQKLATDLDARTTLWRYSRSSGLTPESLTDTEVNNARAKNVNLFGPFMSFLGVWQDGVFATGRQIDLRTTADWVRARIEERISTILVDASNRNEKVPYTDAGISVFAEAVREILTNGVDVGHFVEGTIVVTAPLLEDVLPADRAARLLRLDFEVTAAGAIEQVTVNGFISITT